jgi:ABC-type Fe3+/spermidine/putrescine transport system ATPase subunit
MSIVLEQLTKRYEGHMAVNRVSLDVADGAFFVLLGSSGSGKSTILRMIAGLTPIECTDKGVQLGATSFPLSTDVAQFGSGIDPLS